MASMVAINPLKLDPTRTTTLRSQFVADVERRLTELRRRVLKLVVEDDAFGLDREPRLKLNQMVDNAGEYQFLSDEAKIGAFHEWFDTQVQTGVLQVEGTQQTPWTSKYVQSAYKKGATRAYQDVHAEALAQSPDFYQGSKKQFLEDSFGLAVETNRVKLLAIRAFENMKGLTNDVKKEMGLMLADGLAHGLGPKEVGRRMVNTLDLEKPRARTIARTEIINAYAEGQLDSFEMLGVEELKVDVEWSTAGDGKVCEKCADFNGRVFTVAQARGLIPKHPNCVLGDTRVVSPSALSITRAKYSGPIVEIVTAKGRRLSVTENHVLLTQRGWVRAKELTKGDYLVDASSFDRKVLQDPDNNQDVPSIADQFSSAIKGGGIAVHPAADSRPEDFHGDGKSIHGEVDIVRLDGRLGKNVQIIPGGQSEELPLVFGDVGSINPLSLDSQRRLSTLLVATAAAADCLMGFDDVSSVFLRGSLAHHKAVGLPLVSHGNPVVHKSPSDGLLTEAETSSEFGQRDSGLVLLDHLLHQLQGNFNSWLGEGLASGSDKPHSLDTLAETVRTALQAMGHSFNGEASSVEFHGLVYDLIDSVTSRHVVDTPVYDMETMETVYIANGIVSSNCRCAWMPAFPKKKKKGQQEDEPLPEEVDEEATAEEGDDLGLGLPSGSGGGMVEAPLATIYGHSSTAVMRWMGADQWNFNDARTVLDAYGVPASDATIRAQLTAGRKGERGAPAPLTPEQIEALRSTRATGKRPDDIGTGSSTTTSTTTTPPPHFFSSTTTTSTTTPRRRK